MKRIVKLSIIMLLMMVVFTVNVYAKPHCNITMQTKEVKVELGKEFTVDVYLSNIQSERGIIAIEGTLEYEKDCLTLSKFEGQNSWDTPIKNLSYNEANGKFVIDKKGLAKNDETILKITFIANKTDKKDTTISLKNIIVADGTAPAEIKNVSKNITLTEEAEKPDTTPTPGEEQKPNTKPTPDEEQKPNAKPTPSEEKKTNTTPTPKEETNTILEEEQQETNVIDNEVESTNTNTNQAIEDTTNNGDIETKKNNNFLIFFLLLLIIVIIVIIIYKKRKPRKKKRRMR